MGKIYVVWIGRTIGLFDKWKDCKESIQGFPGAKYKAFANRYEATEAYQTGYHNLIPLLKVPEIQLDCKPALAVDGACSGTTMVGEARGVILPSRREVFHIGPVAGATNNIMEYLAIVRAFRWLERQGMRITIYSDSRTALSWIKDPSHECKTTRYPAYGTPLFNELMIAHRWVRTNDHVPEYLELLQKWDTKSLGEIPADFGRK